jgi:hypothetical protein
MATVNKVIIVGNLGRDPEIRYMPSGDAIAAIYADYRISRASAAFKKKAGFAGPESKQKAKEMASTTTSAGTAAPGADDASSSGDDDDGDGDGDSDGPRRLSQSNYSPATRLPPRAHRRPNLPKPLTRRAFAWLLALALLLAYIGPPGFALLFVQVGHPELASEMLRYKPVLILPTPPGWLPSGERDGAITAIPPAKSGAGAAPTELRAASTTPAICTRSTHSRVNAPVRRSGETRVHESTSPRRIMTTRVRGAWPAAKDRPNNSCIGAQAVATDISVLEPLAQP